MAYLVDVNVGDSVMIGDILISIKNKNGRKARLGIDADRSIDINLVKKDSSKTSKNHEKNSSN